MSKRPTIFSSPWFPFAIAMVLLVVMAVHIRVPNIETRIDDLNIDNNPYQESGDRMAESFGARNMIQVVVHPVGDKMQPFFDDMNALKQDMEMAFDGIRVETLNRAVPLIYRRVGRNATLKEAFTAALDIPVARNLISSDTSSVLIVTFTDKVHDFSTARFDSVADIPREALRVTSVVSQPHIEREVENSIIYDYAMMLPVIFGFFIVFLFYSYRSITSVLFCLLNMNLAFIPSLFFITLFGVNINQVTAPSIPVVVILSLSASIHLITGYRFRAHYRKRNARIRDTIKHYLWPTLLSAITTSISFGSFYLSDSLYIRQFGLVAGSSILTAFLITFLLAPVTLRFIRITPSERKKTGFTGKLEELLVSFHKPVSLAFMGIAVLSLFFINDITFRTDIETYIPVKSRVYNSVQVLQSKFHSIASLDVMIESQPSDTLAPPVTRRQLEGVVSALSDEIKEFPGVLSVESIQDQTEFERQFFMSSMGGAIFSRGNNPFVSEDQKKYRIHVKLSDPEQIPHAKGLLEEHFNKNEQRYRYSLYSDYLYFGFISHGITHSLLKSLLVSALLIILIIFLMTRSIEKTLASIVVNSIPLGFMVLIVVMFGVDMNITTSMSLVICLGLIVDDTIQILYRRVRLKEPMGELGFGILTTSIIVTGGFLSFLLSSSLPTRVFGLICATVFLIAAISDMTVMPWLLREKR